MSKKKAPAKKALIAKSVKSETVEKKTPAAKTTKAESGLSRNQLMLEAKKRGIKNFRVMNKAELSEIVGGAKPDRIAEIQKEAVSRWKSGWGTKKEK